MLRQTVLFEGTNASGTTGLWATNGTATGTHELTRIIGANAGGLQPDGFTVFNGEVLFGGVDLAGRGLWVTNGTAAVLAEGAGRRGLGDRRGGIVAGRVHRRANVRG